MSSLAESRALGKAQLLAYAADMGSELAVQMMVNKAFYASPLPA